MKYNIGDKVRALVNIEICGKILVKAGATGEIVGVDLEYNSDDYIYVTNWEDFDGIEGDRWWTKENELELVPEITMEVVQNTKFIDDKDDKKIPEFSLDSLHGYTLSFDKADESSKKGIPSLEDIIDAYGLDYYKGSIVDIIINGGNLTKAKELIEKLIRKGL